MEDQHAAGRQTVLSLETLRLRLMISAEDEVHRVQQDQPRLVHGWILAWIAACLLEYKIG